MMAALMPESIPLLFQNTGREHEETLIFLVRLEEALQRPITWLELRAPKRKGAPPREFQYEIVNFKTASRKGEPFRIMLESLRDYRATKGVGPIAPWARQRICTAYLKHRTQENYLRNGLKVDSYDSFIGLRADEPDRVSAIMARETQTKGYRCPLHAVGITKPHVLEFWGWQSFDLRLNDYQGNCTACFLKDQADIARSLGEPGTDPDWWIEMEGLFPDFGGRNFPGYEQLAAERDPRLAIEKVLRADENAVPENTFRLQERRFKLVVKQEARRIKEGSAHFSCSCEQTVALAEEE